MINDYRAEVAKYYDLHTDPYDDVSFYVKMLRNKKERVLDLGCGTGRVLLPLVPHCQYIHGVDNSETMLEICRRKLAKEGIGLQQAQVGLADITHFDLGQMFDLIIAPFRVFQCLDSEKEIDNFFECVQKHLASNGRCILNVFKTIRQPDEIEKMWSDDTEYLLQEIPYDDGKITVSEVRNKFRRKPLSIYPKQIIRKYKGGQIVDQSQFDMTLRCYYPDEFEQLILSHNFVIINRWGGYNGEEYGQGNELVVEFENLS